MNKPRILLILAIVIVAGIVYISVQNTESSFIRNLFGLDAQENPSEDEGGIIDRLFPTSGSSEDSEGETSVEPRIGASGCPLQKISYKISDFETNPVCDYIVDELCTNKTIHCSAQMTNLDHETSGTFELKFDFITEDGILLESRTHSELIGARESKYFESIVIIQDENAKKEINCLLDPVKTPDKEIC